MTLTIYLYLLFVAYLLGTIPTGLLLTKMAGLGDIRAIGSGNIGATNVMRTGRKGLGTLTLLLDAGKGLLAVYIACTLTHDEDFIPLAGLFAVLGHVFPVWLHFKGGKGVATAIGVFFGIHWLLGLTVCAIWLSSFLLMRISSASSILSIGYSAIAAYLLAGYSAGLLGLALAMLIIYTHRSNIMRLLAGTESSFRK